MDYFNDFWLGFVTAEFVRRCVDESEATCHGCRDGKISPLLHIHHQLGLKDKIIYHMEPIRGVMMPLIPSLYEEFKVKVNSPNMNKNAYVTSAKFFLVAATPESLYFGRYLNEQNDAFIHHRPAKEKIMTVGKGIKRTKKRKVVISQDVPWSAVPENL